MGLHRVEVMVIMKQNQSFNYTKSCYDDSNGFPNANTGFSKRAVILGTLNSHGISTDLAKLESAKEVFDCFKILV
jgi:hypothetical protein